MEGLKKIVGEDNILCTESQLLTYSSDSSKLKGECLCVVLPKSLPQLQEIVNYARRHNIDIVPRGGGSSLAGGAVPQKSIVIDLSRLNKIHEINAEKKYAVIDPGVICDDLNEQLKKFSLIYPVIPSSSSIATIGGMLSTNAAGLWAIKYGTASDWVEEIEVIDGNGYVHKYSKKEDIMNFVGMEGTTGIIVKAKIKITSAPQQKSLSIFPFYTLQKLVDKFLQEKRGSSLLSLEYIDNIIAQKIGLSDSFYLVAEYDNDLGQHKDEKEIEDFMTKRESIGSILTSEGHSIMEDPYVPEDKLPEFLRWLNDHNVPTFGHIGIGVLHPRFLPDQEKLVDEMLKKVVEMKGKVSGEHGIGISKTKYSSVELKGKVILLKKKYDPMQILNRNKILPAEEIPNERKHK
jgi:glycolate oxidase